MRAALLICGATFAWSFIAGAQGVHLSSGDSLVVGFNQVSCQPLPERSLTGATAYLGFGSDALDPGESLRLEMLENDSGDPSLATQIHNPVARTVAVNISTPSAAWLDFQGLVRATMISGDVDVTFADFRVVPQQFTWCQATVSVPEPSIVVLVALAGAVCAAIRIFRRSDGRKNIS